MWEGKSIHTQRRVRGTRVSRGNNYGDEKKRIIVSSSGTWKKNTNEKRTAEDFTQNRVAKHQDTSVKKKGS